MDFQVDWLIVTALDIEYKAICARLKSPNLMTGVTLPAKIGSIADKRVVCINGGKGQGKAATAVVYAATQWKPSRVLFVGIAGGFPAYGGSLGNVIVADYICKLDYGRIRDGKFERRIGNDVPVDRGLLQYAETILDSDWSKSISVCRPDNEVTTASVANIGHIGSSDMVIDDPGHPFFREAHATLPELAAVEMEGSAAGAAISLLQTTDQIGFIVIRAISDQPASNDASSEAMAPCGAVAGAEQRALWRKYAADAAAAFGEALISAATFARPRRAPVEVQKRTERPFVPEYGELFGVDEEISRCVSHFNSDNDHLHAYHGIGGVGKTALSSAICFAVQKAALVSDCLFFTSSQRFLLQGDKAGLTYERFLAELAHRLKVKPVPIDLKVQLGRRPLLLFLDNLETSAEPQNELVAKVCSLIEGTKARVLMTSRQAFTDYRVCDTRLSGLDRIASVKLIRYLAQDTRPTILMDDDDMDRIAEATGGIPLAIKLVVKQLQYDAVDKVLQRLGKPDLETSNEYRAFYRGIIAWSWEAARSQARSASEEDAEVFLTAIATAPANPSAAIGETHLREMTGFEQTRFDATCALLRRLSLLETTPRTSVHPESRFYLHPLVQQFVKSDLIRSLHAD